MGSATASSVLLVILNVIQVTLGLGISAVSIWFFTEVQAIAGLREANYYLVNANIYWPQVISWVFLLVGVLVLFVSCCGFIGTNKKSTGFVVTFLIFELFITLVATAAAVIALMFADSASTDDFIKDTLGAIFRSMKDDERLQKSFGNLEKRLQCCGVSSPLDYTMAMSSKTIPAWCCDASATYCDSTNDLVIRRYGCYMVVVSYVHILIRSLAGASVLIAFLGVISTFVAVVVKRSLRKKPKALKVLETEKILS